MNLAFMQLSLTLNPKVTKKPGTNGVLISACKDNLATKEYQKGVGPGIGGIYGV